MLASLRPRVELASAAAARRAFEVQAPEPVRVLVALAARPALVDPATISRRCRLALALLGIPVLAEPRAAAFAAGVPVLVGEPASRGGGALRMLAA